MSNMALRRLPESIRCCRFHVRVNSLWLWWYAAIVVISHAYLMYRAVDQCKEYNELPWRTAEKPVTELYVYICLLVVGIMCVPFFILTAIFKVGNYANDGVRLGRDDVRGSQELSSIEGQVEEEGEEQEGRLQVLWKHLPPLCNGLHVLAAFVLLLPRILLDARKIQHGFVPPGEIWRSELDVIFGPGNPEYGSIGNNIVPPDAPLNQSSGSTTPRQLSSNHDNNYNILPITPEFVNWMLSLVIYSLRYPAVFWYSRKLFSMVFAFLLFAASFQYMLAYNAIGILYKYQINDTMYAHLQLVLPAEALIILYLVTNTVVFISSISIFSYGYYHYDESYRKFITQHQYHRSRRKLTPAVGCEGYVPHTVATIALMLFVASRATVVYDVVTLYRTTDNKVLLAAVVWDVAYMLIWIITWFVFTIKQTWRFRVWASVLSSESTSEIYTIRNAHARDSTLMPQNTDINLEVSQSDVNISGARLGVNLHDSQTGNVGQLDVVDSAIDGHLPNPMHQRSSGERRSGSSSNVRVTFEEDNLDPNDLSRQSPRRKSKDSSRRRKQQRRADHPDVDERGNHRSVDDRPKNVFGDFPLQETPENTLTRSYRHSIRDKCGQYYRHSREFQSPPAAQSSPVLGQRNDDRSEQSPPRDSSVQMDRPSRNIPVNDLPARDIGHRELQSREPLPHRDALPQRRSGSHEPERPPRPARNISPTRSQPQPIQNKPHISSKPPPIGGERVLPPLPPHMKSSNGTTPCQVRSQLQSQQQPILDIQYNIPYKYDNHAAADNALPSGMHRNNLSGKPPIGGATRLAGDRPPQPNRDIRVIGMNALHSKKPEMGRRDSALPSSNETSSNDSTENVLCSQV